MSLSRSAVSRRRFIKIAGAAGVVLVVGGAAGYYALTRQVAPPATQGVTAVSPSTVTQSTRTTQTTLPGNSVQDVPENIGLRMQYQETSEWCWIAVATNINHFYNPASTLTQGELMTAVGQTIGKWLSTTQCYPSDATLASDPELASVLANPYTTSAKYVLNKPTLLIPAVCVKPGGVGDALDINGNRNSPPLSSLTLATITDEMETGHPIAVDIKWTHGGGQHCVAIAGVLNDMLLICDLINGESVIQYETFPTAYRGGASWRSAFLTKKEPNEDVPEAEGAHFCGHAT